MSHPSTDHPVLLIDTGAPLRELHACLAERVNAVLKYLDLITCTHLPDYAEHDINTVNNIARYHGAGCERCVPSDRAAGA